MCMRESEVIAPANTVMRGCFIALQPHSYLAVSNYRSDEKSLTVFYARLTTIRNKKTEF